MKDGHSEVNLFITWQIDFEMALADVLVHAHQPWLLSTN